MLNLLFTYLLNKNTVEFRYKLYVYNLCSPMHIDFFIKTTIITIICYFLFKKDLRNIILYTNKNNINYEYIKTEFQQLEDFVTRLSHTIWDISGILLDNKSKKKKYLYCFYKKYCTDPVFRFNYVYNFYFILFYLFFILCYSAFIIESIKILFFKTIVFNFYTIVAYCLWGDLIIFKIKNNIIFLKKILLTNFKKFINSLKYKDNIFYYYNILINNYSFYKEKNIRKEYMLEISKLIIVINYILYLTLTYFFKKKLKNIVMDINNEDKIIYKLFNKLEDIAMFLLTSILKLFNCIDYFNPNFLNVNLKNNLELFVEKIKKDKNIRFNFVFNLYLYIFLCILTYNSVFFLLNELLCELYNLYK